MRGLFSCTYLGPVSYYSALLGHEVADIEDCENYQKQSYRNRCRIATANKLMELTIPVQKPAEGKPLRDVKIAYQMDWQRQHWNAIESAYNLSPYFEYYVEYLQPYYQAKETYLVDLDWKLQDTVLQLMQIDKKIGKTPKFELHPTETHDLRNAFSPKTKPNETRPYYQVFTEKFGYQPDLSIVDLLFNQGPESIYYL